MPRSDSSTPNMALFCDFENIALGVRESRYDAFDIQRVLERLLLKGSIVVKKAYCDWERYKEHKAGMHQAAFELIEIPHVRMSGKNSADIRMVVDALDLCYTKSHVDCFVIISGDSDFSPLVSKLRENNKTVIGVGVKNSTSDLLMANCDEFIFYDDLVRETRRRGTTRTRATPNDKAPDKAASKTQTPAKAAAADAEKPTPEKTGARTTTRKPRGRAGEATAAEPPQTLEASPPPELAAAPTPALLVPAPSPAVASAAEVIAPLEDEDVDVQARVQRGLDLVIETLDALVAERDEDDRIWGSMIKQTLKRRNPGFNEGYYGFKSFNRMLEEARDRQLLALEIDARSGGYVVRPI